MNCSTARELISRQLDNEISPKDAAQLRSHTRGCSACEAYQAALQQADQALSSLAARASQEASARDLDALTRAALAGEPWVPAEANHQTRRPRTLLDRLFPAPVRSFARAISVAALLLVTSAAVVSGILDAHMPPEPVRGPGHIESFTAETDSQGRVYATVIGRNSTYLDQGGDAK